jgi:MOSC domain
MRPVANAALTARSCRRDRTVDVLETGSRPDVRHLDAEELEAGLDEILLSPSAEGTVQLIARRPSEGEREVLEEATLDLVIGLVGDNWSTRGSSRTPDRSANPNAQLTLMNARVIDLVAAGDRERWALAGDQFYVDFDLTAANLPPGTRLTLGSAVIEVSAEPHTGCAKFHARFGGPAHRFVNTRAHRGLNLRGINTRIVEPGTVRRGDTIRKL